MIFSDFWFESRLFFLTICPRNDYSVETLASVQFCPLSIVLDRQMRSFFAFPSLARGFQHTPSLSLHIKVVLPFQGTRFQIRFQSGSNDPL